MMRRRRKCAECSKPLGGTTYRCHECGGEKAADPPGTQPMYDAARVWKILFGVFPDKIEKAHRESKERNPRYDSEEDVWEHEKQ